MLPLNSGTVSSSSGAVTAGCSITVPRQFCIIVCTLGNGNCCPIHTPIPQPNINSNIY